MKLSEDYMRFWMFIPILLIIPILHPANVELIVYIDQYSIVLWPLIISLSIFLFLSGFGYFLLKNRDMNERMTKLHKKYILFGACVCLSVFLILLVKNNDLSQPPDISTLSTFTLDQFLALTFLLGMFIAFMGTMYYIINVVVTIFFTDTPTLDSQKKKVEE